jgi:hypothetical protein
VTATRLLARCLSLPAAVLLGLALPASLLAAPPWRPPDMEKELFDVDKLDVDKFDRSGLVGSLLSIARDFDQKDDVDFELRAYAIAIAGRIDPDNERVERCLEQLNKNNETLPENADRARVLSRLRRGLKALLKEKDNEANQACAAYVADIALRFASGDEDITSIEESRDELADAGHDADWKGILGAARHSGGPPGVEIPQFVEAEVTMPGGDAKDFANPQSRVNGLVVQQLPNGAHAGAASAVNATALPEVGQEDLLFTFNQRVGPMMGGCLEEVIKFLRIRYRGQDDKIPDGMKIEIGFQNKYQLKDGPSAAVVFTLLLDSLFSGNELDDEFAATGDITADGMVQKIGGVAAKIRGATKEGCKIVGIPEDNAKGVADVLLMDGPQQLIDIQIFTLEDYDQALAVARKDKSQEVQATLDSFQKIADKVKTDHELLKNSKVQSLLQQVLEQMPNHLSAQLLLDYAQDMAPTQLTVGGTFQEIQISSSAVYRPLGMMLFKGDMDFEGDIRKDARESLEKLQAIADVIDPRVKGFHQAMSDVVQLVIDGRKDGETDKELTERLKEAMERMANEERKLREDPEIAEELM